MLKVRYTENIGVEIAGSSEDIRNLQKNISKLEEISSHISIQTDLDCDPMPYNSCIHQIVIKQSNHPNKIIVVDNILIITGSKETLRQLESFMDFPLDASPGMHNHYEYYEGNIWIDSESIPLVISLL